MKAIWLAIVRFILGRYAPTWAAALEGGEAAYAAAEQKEQAAAVGARVAQVQQIQAGVEAEKEKAHAQVAGAADPDAVVNEQLRGLGLVAPDKGGDES
jgi:hypothetical protein